MCVCVWGQSCGRTWRPHPPPGTSPVPRCWKSWILRRLAARFSRLAARPSRFVARIAARGSRSATRGAILADRPYFTESVAPGPASPGGFSGWLAVGRSSGTGVGPGAGRRGAPGTLGRRRGDAQSRGVALRRVFWLVFWLAGCPELVEMVKGRPCGRSCRPPALGFRVWTGLADGEAWRTRPEGFLAGWVPRYSAQSCGLGDSGGFDDWALYGHAGGSCHAFLAVLGWKNGGKTLPQATLAANGIVWPPEKGEKTEVWRLRRLRRLRRRRRRRRLLLLS